ncbi:hypothetical protein OIDMADRAFT_37184 [Oidiodendron maius Zn]|uniref:Uncharacterized protein n=1 Tax=Oidiodendron maius (strain Zn) TaxID=913774 RepID=A0A0C3E0F6_OIDMZ|nr:hypothetical protein OIDMADRAFT_37184 [Oidiodendron maius Zn]
MTLLTAFLAAACDYLSRLGTPLHLRGTITRLRHSHKRPYLALLRLFIPFPSWSFPLPEPVPPYQIVENCIWESQDTPLRSLYRLYKIFMTREYAFLGLKTEYFWHQSGRKLGLGIQRKGPAIERKYRRDLYLLFIPKVLPSWTENILPIKADMLRNLPPTIVCKGDLILEANRSSKVFAKRNIVTNVG